MDFVNADALLHSFVLAESLHDLPPWIFTALIALVKIAIVIGVMLGLVSYTVMAERKVCAWIQDRIGPNRTGIPLTKIRIWGLGQPIADALKFVLKEQFTPKVVNQFFFYLAPPMAMVPALLTIAVVPFASIASFTIPFTDLVIPKPGVIADLNIGILYVFAITSLGVYGIVLAGWASNSKYPFFGGIRSSAQMISYEVAMGLSVIPVFLLIGNLNLSGVVKYQQENGWLIAPFFAPFQNWSWTFSGLITSILFFVVALISFMIFMISAFAETNRLPFDLPESEQELVGGYHTEYGGMKFALFFLGEYAAMIVASCLMVTLFLGGWSLPWGLPMGEGTWYGFLFQIVVFLAKMALFIFLFIWVRWTLPRFRYDQLMDLGWKVFLPIALANILATGLIIAATTPRDTALAEPAEAHAQVAPALQPHASLVPVSGGLAKAGEPAVR